MKKTIKKRAFVSAIAMLIVSAIVLTSSTFAWFSMSKEAKIESMDLNVTSPEGIQISANAETWTSQLTKDDLFNAKSTGRYKAYEGNVNYLPTDLKPVSSGLRSFNTATGYADFFIANLNDSGVADVKQVTQSTATAANDAGFVAFDIFLKVANATTVYFGTSEFNDNSNSDILTALRFGFQILGNTTETDAATAIALKNGSFRDSYLYEVDSENRSADSIARGNSTGAVGTNYISSTSAGGNKVNEDSVLYNTYTEASPANRTTDKSAASAKSFSLAAGVTKLRVYIWVEGNDIDCRNSVAGAALSAAIKFTID